MADFFTLYSRIDSTSDWKLKALHALEYNSSNKHQK